MIHRKKSLLALICKEIPCFLVENIITAQLKPLLRSSNVIGPVVAGRRGDEDHPRYGDPSFLTGVAGGFEELAKGLHCSISRILLAWVILR